MSSPALIYTLYRGGLHTNTDEINTKQQKHNLDLEQQIWIAQSVVCRYMGFEPSTLGVVECGRATTQTTNRAVVLYLVYIAKQICY